MMEREPRQCSVPRSILQKCRKEKRRRTMYFISMPDHHGGDRGGSWLHENFKSIFPKTAVITNSEHVAVSESSFGSSRGVAMINPH